MPIRSAGWELDANTFLRRFCRDDVHIVSTTWHIQNAQNKYRVKYNS